MLGGLAGLATQGSFMGNSGGLAGQYPLGLVGQIGGINEKVAEAGSFRNPFGLVGAIAQGLPGNEQGPAQGPNTPVKNYPGMGYGPVGPMGGGLPPTPMASMFGGPQMGQAGGLLGNANFFSDPMTIKRVS